MEAWDVTGGRSIAERTERERARWAAIVLVLGSVQFVLEMAVEQAFYPGFDPLTRAISDLGGRGAGAMGGFFDLSVYLVGEGALLGAVLLIGALPQRRSLRLGMVLLVLAGIGAMGVGLFPEYDGSIHGVMAAIAFIGAGLALLAIGRGFYKVGENRPLAVGTAIGGVVDLVALVLFTLSSHIPGLEGLYGLLERLIVAPVLLWAVVYGVWLLSGRARLRSAAVPELRD